MKRPANTCLPRTPAFLPALLALVCLASAACDRAVVEPALAAGDEASLLRAAGLKPAAGQHTLSSVVLEAARAARRSGGEAAVVRLLEPVRTGQARLEAAARAGDEPVLRLAREELREAQLQVVLEALGASAVEGVLAGVASGLAEAAAALDSTPPTEGVPALRLTLAELAAALEHARTELAAGNLAGALASGTDAAEGLARLRRSVLDEGRLRALSDLFRQAREAIEERGEGAEPELAALLAEHATLQQAAAAEIAGGDRERAHAALAAVRDMELRVALQLHGSAAAEGVVMEVGEALAALRSAPRSPDPRLQRMLRAAVDLNARAAAALARGDAVAALDLSSYAAGLVNAYRLASAGL